MTLWEHNTRVLLRDILDFIGIEGVVDEAYHYKLEQVCNKINLALSTKETGRVQSSGRATREQAERASPWQAEDPCP